MTKTVFEQMADRNAEENIENFRQLRMMDYEHKVYHAEDVAQAYVDECREREMNCHVSVGGLDSITLYLFLRDLGKRRHINELCDITGITVSVLEDKSLQRVHQDLGLITLKPLKQKVKVIQEFGFPVLSKEIAAKIELLQNPTEDNATVRHAIITGETGEYGGNQTDSRMKMSQKWLELFGGYENERENVHYGVPNFKVSSKCCYYLKEKPCDDWAKAHNSVPFLGLMASEGGRRAKSLMINGCNYWGKSTVRSCPFAIFEREELLRLALDLHVPVPEIYGEITERDGHLITTGAQRTGCSMCGFGIQLEKRPHRFDKLKESNQKEWEFWMRNCCKDPDGTPYGWGRVLDYIGIEWESPVGSDMKGQAVMEGWE